MLIEPQDGNWYVVVICEECESLIVVFRDLTEGKGSLKRTASHVASTRAIMMDGTIGIRANYRRRDQGSIRPKLPSCRL